MLMIEEVFNKHFLTTNGPCLLNLNKFKNVILVMEIEINSADKVFGIKVKKYFLQ